MTKQEFAKFAMALKTYYPKENILPNEQAMELWFYQLQDIGYTVAEAGLNKWVALNKWSPTIADIRGMATSIVSDDIPSEAEAWGMVRKAYESLDWNNPETEFNKLPEPVKNAVGNASILKEWAQLDISECETVISSNFMRNYRAQVKVHQENRQMPERLKVMIADMQNKQKLLEAEG